MENLDKFFSDNERLSKEEFDRLSEDYDKRKIGSHGNVDLNEVVLLMKDIVKRAADGFKRVVYDVIHSVKAKVIHILGIPIRFLWGNWVHHDSVRMLRPSYYFCQGNSFALDGNCGFVPMDLTKAVIPHAVTIQVDKCNRRNRYADCRVYGWFSRREVTPDSRMYFLGNFTYDLENSSPQTFNVSESAGVIDTIKLDFTSNPGNPSCTCIYRFSVQGYICT